MNSSNKLIWKPGSAIEMKTFDEDISDKHLFHCFPTKELMTYTPWTIDCNYYYYHYPYPQLFTIWYKDMSPYFSSIVNYLSTNVGELLKHPSHWYCWLYMLLTIDWHERVRMVIFERMVFSQDHHDKGIRYLLNIYLHFYLDLPSTNIHRECLCVLTMCCDFSRFSEIYGFIWQHFLTICTLHSLDSRTIRWHCFRHSYSKQWSMTFNWHVVLQWSNQGLLME